MKSQERLRTIVARHGWAGASHCVLAPLLRAAVLLAFVLSGGAIVDAGQLGYVANGDGSVSIFDTDDGQVVKDEPRLKTDT